MGQEASRVNAINLSKCEIFVCLHSYIHCRQKKKSRPIGIKSALCCGILNSEENRPLPPPKRYSCQPVAFRSIATSLRMVATWSPLPPKQS